MSKQPRDVGDTKALAKALEPPALGISETAFRNRVIELAEVLGSKTCFVRKSLNGRGGTWQTSTSVVGWPDLTIYGRGGVLFVELKTEKGEPSDKQVECLGDLERAGAETHIWRPSDWPQIVDRLSNV